MPKPAIFQLILLVNSLFSGQFPNILFCIFSCENLGYHCYFLHLCCDDALKVPHESPKILFSSLYPVFFGKV